MDKINLDERVVIKNLCDWALYFSRIESNGEVKVPPKGKIRLSRAEIQAQVYNNNVFFVGIDGEGSHARIFIEDQDTRVMLGFEDVETNKDGSKKVVSEQKVLDEETVKKIIDYKRKDYFEKAIKEHVKTAAEKRFLVEEAKRQGINDYDKIKYIEDYTGIKFE